MYPAFYPPSGPRSALRPSKPSLLAILAVLCLPIGACGDSAVPAEQTPSVAPNPASYSNTAPYEPVKEGEMAQRLMSKLKSGSKESLRFAKQELGKMGDAVVPQLVAAIETEIDLGSASTANFLGALTFTETQINLPILIEVLDRHPLPLVRSTAIDTIAQLQQKGLEEGLLAYADRETEQGPLARLIPCLGRVGGDASALFLEKVIADWVNPVVHEGNGQKAWEAVQTIDSPEAERVVEDWVDKMPPIHRVTGLARLVEQGDVSLAASMREYTDPQRYPAAGVRKVAVNALAFAGDYEGVLECTNDPDLRVRLAVVDAMRTETAAKLRLGTPFLEAAAAGDEHDLALAALMALADRGQNSAIEPWLNQVNGFPTRPGSIAATQIFLRGDLKHPGLVPILISRWPYSDADQRVDLGRVMASNATPEAVEFLLKVVNDSEEAVTTRLYSITSLGNCGPIATEALLSLWDEGTLTKDSAERVLNALIRHPEDPKVRSFFEELASSAESSDFGRAYALASLPKAYGVDAYPTLMKAREQAEQDRLRVFIESLLHEYF